MSKWCVEYKVHAIGGYSKTDCVSGIEAKNGNEAIEYVKAHVIGCYKFKVFHDDEED